MSFVDRLNRAMADALCLPEGSRVVYGGEGWNLIYNRPGLPMRTVAGLPVPPRPMTGMTSAASCTANC